MRSGSEADLLHQHSRSVPPKPLVLVTRCAKPWLLLGKDAQESATVLGYTPAEWDAELADVEAADAEAAEAEAKEKAEAAPGMRREA